MEKSNSPRPARHHFQDQQLVDDHENRKAKDAAMPDHIPDKFVIYAEYARYLMERIKKYEQVNADDQYLSFRISRMEDIYDERNGKPDHPHRHAYYTILFILKASGSHMVDFTTYELKPSQLYFIAPGQVHQVIEYARSTGYAILFSPEFLVENNIPVSFIEDLKLFSGCGESPPLDLNEKEVSILSAYGEQMIQLSNSSMKFRNLALGSYLKLFLIQGNNLCTLDIGNLQNQEAGNTILRNFRNLVETHHHQQHSIKEYGNLLHVTPDHLNKVVKSLTGKSAKEYIQDRIILSAKRQLYFSSLSSKEIAYDLGFSESSNFSAFFKKKTGLAPSAFRENLK